MRARAKRTGGACTSKRAREQRQQCLPACLAMLGAMSVAYGRRGWAGGPCPCLECGRAVLRGSVPPALHLNYDLAGGTEKQNTATRSGQQAPWMSAPLVVSALLNGRPASRCVIE